MTAPVATERFNRVYRDLLVADVQRQLSPLSRVRSIPDDEDLAYALSVATRLALEGTGETEESAACGRLAYEVVVRSLNFANGATSTVRAISDLVLSRIGNFPARALIQEQAGESDALGDPFLQTEIMVRGLENQLRGTGSEIILTDFQVRLIQALEAKRAVSVSAPTSAGKSFTLEIELLRRLKDQESYVAVFVVPTRALIRQVTFDLVRLLRDHALSVPVLSAPAAPGTDSEGKRGAIYVLTQERLATLLSAPNPHLRVDAIIVDEAHEIGEASRGQTLERVLATALGRFPGARLFFSSPLRSNPDFLLRLFHRANDEGESFVEHLSPVTQNIINLHPVSGKPKELRMELAMEGQRVPLGTLELPFRFRDSYMGKIAVHFTHSDDTSIIYCNGPSSADRTAAEVAEAVEQESEDEDLQDLSSFLRQEVHPRYLLAELVRKGVAFHYGNIPQIIRGRVEELLREKRIRFVCCTSTLLQGMNLPAKNIFIEDPKKGRGSPMKKGDFWNLVGRAGRLSKEFHGNVFCVFGKKWEVDLDSGKLAEIESAYEVAVGVRTKELLDVVKDPPVSAESAAFSWAEQTYARIFAEYVSTGKRLADRPEQDARQEFPEIDKVSSELKRTLPDDVFLTNYYVHPTRLETLARHFRGLPDLRSALPTYPWSPRSYYRLRDIFTVLNELLIHSPKRAHEYHAFLAIEWMKGSSLKQLVSNKLEWARVSNDSAEINTAIRELFDDLESELRYKYVKYTKIYHDVLKAVLGERGMAKEADGLLPIHLFLEYGAASQTLINLMAIGLSRTSAILFKSFLSLRDELDSARCQEYVESINIERSNLPAICKTEIARLKRKRD
jgi:hypothetical protein